LFSGSNTSDASFNVIQEFMDGSGITFLSDVSFNQHATFKDVSINRIGPVDGSLIIMGDLSVNGNIFVSGGAIGGGGGSGTDASFDRIGEFTDGSGISFLNDVSMNTRLVVPDASFNRIGPIDGSLVVVGDLSVNGNVKFSGDIFANNLNGTLQKITIFDDISCTTTNGIWRDIPQSRDFAAGTVLIHDITVSSSIDSGYIDWPEGGHKYILSRSELTNGYQDFETFKYIFDSQNVSEEIKHTFVENITNNSTYSDWKLTISGDGVVTDASDNLKWETIVLSPVARAASSHIENYTLFDASAASSVTTDTIWEASNSIEIPQGSMVFHDIKVSGYIGDGYVDWPLAGHEFNFDRKKGGSYTWDHSKSYEQVKHVFTSRNAHEEQTYSILETVAETNTYTQWRCDFSGSGGLTDANDKLTWKMTVITPGDYNIRNDYERIKRLEIFNGTGSSAGNPYPPYWHAAQTHTVAPGTIMIHNIKVASRIQTNFVNWPDGGHQYNIYRVDNSSNGYGDPVETFKYIFDGREDLEEASYTFTEIIDNTSTFVDWKIDVSGEGVENDTSNILSWDVAMITPKLLTAAPASLMTTHNVFDNVSYDGASSWDISSNPVINVPKGSIVLHDIKVSGKIATGYVDWPLSGHEFIFQRRYNGDNGGYTWNGDVNKTYEHVKHIFTGQGVHEEQDYNIIEQHTTQNRDFTRWKCDLSGNGAALDSNDTLNWTVTVITPSEFNHLNDICYGQVVPAGMLDGTIPAARIPGDMTTYVQTGSPSGSISQDIYGEKSFKNDVDISGKLVVDDDVSFNAHISAVDASFQNDVDIAGKLVVSGFVGTSTTGALTVPSGTTAQQPTGVQGMIRFNSTYSNIEYYDGTHWKNVGSISAIGGTVTNSAYRVHKFTSSGTFTVTTGGIMDYLIVGGGGGGGGRAGGGGGAGGLIYETNQNIASGTYTVIVGSGGGGGGGGGGAVNSGGNGSSSSIFSKTALGGGGGAGAGTGGNTGLSGGSGGGGRYGGGGGASTQNSTYGYGLGNSGGGSTGASTYNGGGGGGAGAVGQSGTANDLGDGGDGKEYDITGTNTYYAGGGGGGSHNPWPGAASTGGLGGGGASGTNAGGGTAGVSGTTNLGGGGGAGSTDGGNGGAGGTGGSGIVIIRYVL